MILMGMGESGKTTYAKKIVEDNGYEFLSFDSFHPYVSEDGFYKALESVIKILNENPNKNYVLDGYAYLLNGKYLGRNFEYLRENIKHKIKPVVIFTQAELISERVNKVKRGSPDKVNREFVIKVYEDIQKYWDLSNAEFIDCSNKEFKKVESYEKVMQILSITKKDIIDFSERLKNNKGWDKHYQTIELPFGYKIPSYNANYDYESWNGIKDIIDYKGKKVADLGSNNGFVCFKIKERGADFVTGYDIKPAIETAKEIAYLKGLDVNFEVLDLDNQEIPKDYDIVLLLNTLHHLKNPQFVLEQVFSKGTNVIMEVQFEGFSPKIQEGWERMQENTTEWNKEKIIEIGKAHNHKVKNIIKSRRHNKRIMLFQKW